MKKDELIKLIKQKEKELSQLQYCVDKSDICSDLYNKTVLEKAILKKELDELGQNKFAQKIKNFLPKKKVLICDYFK